MCFYTPMASSERFGYEWHRYSAMHPNYERQFRNWIGPLGPEDFSHKQVLDAGCGMGRNSYWPAKYGAERVVAFDMDERSLEAARRTLEPFPHASVVSASVYDIKWEGEFDIAFSIGVIHHLKDPVLALKNMRRAVKKGGTVLVWVYSYEGNEWIVRFVDPVRKNITSRLPLWLVHALSYIPSVPLWFFAKLFRGPTGYLKQISTFDFWHVHSIVFDQLIPEVANYWKKSEVERLFSECGFESVTIHEPSNKSGWTIVATV